MAVVAPEGLMFAKAGGGIIARSRSVLTGSNVRKQIVELPEN